MEKTKPDGTVKDEITLACNALRQDLLSPNEFIRGRTLRLVSKIHDTLETLIHAISENLDHRHFYVRRNALMCLYSIYQHYGSEFETATEDIQKLLLNESDLTTKRNAFMLLSHVDSEKALSYLRTVIKAENPLQELGDILQLQILEVLRKMCKADPG